MKRCLCIALCLALSAVGASSRSVRHEHRLGKTFYTRVNIWYENPRSIPSTNFHRGGRIPAGTPVKILGMQDPQITFLDEATGLMTLSHVRRHTRIPFETWFENMFSETDPKGPETPYADFSETERRAIAQGTIVPGMRRAAVLMAYGYPPSHRTPDLDGDRWIYWRDRRTLAHVDFGPDGRTTDAVVRDFPSDNGELLVFDPVGKEFHTAVNIWRADPSRIYSINYHEGPMIPAGTKVKIQSYGDELIGFVVDGETESNTIVHLLRYSNIQFDELFDRLFSTENVRAEGGPFHAFSEEEQRHIRQGTIGVGMSKPAVLMAYGYPPGHRTPDLDHHIWVYWLRRGERLTVYFRNDRIIATEP